MNALLLTLIVLSASANAAVPATSNTRFIEGTIIRELDKIVANLRRQNFDPLELENKIFEITPPVTNLYSVFARTEDVVVKGITNIRVNRINYAILAAAVRFDVSLPEICVSIGKAHAGFSIGRLEASGKISGSVCIEEINISGQVRLRIGLLGGISLRDVTINFLLGVIESDLKVKLLGNDISDEVNDYFGNQLPKDVKKYKSDINDLLTYFLTEIIKANL